MDLLLSTETGERNRTLKGESQRPLLAIMETVNLYITDFPVPLLLFHEKKMLSYNFLFLLVSLSYGKISAL